MTDTYKIIKYADSTNVWGESLFLKESDYNLVFQNYDFSSQVQDKVKDDEILILYSFLRDADLVIRYPDTVWMALSRIGGLLAIFKVSMLLQYFHQYLFEKGFSQPKSINHNEEALLLQI